MNLELLLSYGQLLNMGLLNLHMLLELCLEDMKLGEGKLGQALFLVLNKPGRLSKCLSI